RPPGPTLFPYTTLFRSTVETHTNLHARHGLLASSFIDVRLLRSARVGLSIDGLGLQILLDVHHHVLRAILSHPVPVVCAAAQHRSEEHTSELQSRENLV